MTTINPDLLFLTPIQMEVLFPLLWVLAIALATVVLSVFKTISPKWSVFLITIFGSGIGIFLSSKLLHYDPISIFNGMMVADSYYHLFCILILGSALVTSLMSFRYLDREKIQHPEYYALLLFSAIGMMVMVSALDLIVIFIALELMSLSVYTLVGFRRSDRRSNEASLKYFVLGGAASAIMLYGVALLYGATASTNITSILQHLNSNGGETSLLFTLGVWLVLAGFLFKVASVPFHMWMPDVYEGAPAPVTGFMTTGLKAASFAAFVRVFISTGYGAGLAETVEQNIHHVIWICAVLTMVVGNVIALTQTNLKRMLAYSSIAHTGYLLVGMLAGSQSDQGYAPVITYLFAYAIMNIGAFAVISILAARNDEGLNLPDVSGLARRHPWLAFSLAVFLFSMAGIPPTAGFVAKYLLFYSAIQAGETGLVVISVLCSAVSVFYYLRVLVYMYMRDPVGAPADSRASIWGTLAVGVSVFLTLQLGLLPEGLVEAAKQAMVSL